MKLHKNTKCAYGAMQAQCFGVWQMRQLHAIVYPDMWIYLDALGGLVWQMPIKKA